MRNSYDLRLHTSDHELGHVGLCSVNPWRTLALFFAHDCHGEECAMWSPASMSNFLMSPIRPRASSPPVTCSVGVTSMLNEFESASDTNGANEFEHFDAAKEEC